MTESAEGWARGERVWLLPDIDKREVKSNLPGLVVKQLASGRVRVVYIDMHCLLTKTVEPKRLRRRQIPCQSSDEKRLDKELTRA